MPKLEDLNEAQQRAATHIHGPCVVVAGAGSGKTAMLITRVSQLIRAGVVPSKILCCTFTRKATKEMRERIEREVGEQGKQVVVNTIHGLAWGMIRPKLKQWKPIKNNAWIFEVVLGPKSQVNRFGTGLAKDITVEEAMLAIGKAKNANQRPAQVDDPIIRRVYQTYEAFKKARQMLDFEDFLLKANEFMKDPQFAHEMQSRFTHVSVDEFQDVNLVQWELLQRLVEPHRNLFVVGDDFQSIYGFRGSNPELILKFSSYYPEAATILLETNYRSREPVIKASNRVIAINKKQMKKRLVAHRTGGEPVRVIHAKEEFDQAERILETIQSLKTAFPELTWSDFAVLYRTNQEAMPFEEVFSEKEVPYEINDGTHFYDNYRIKPILSYMRLMEALNHDELPETENMIDALKAPRGFLKEEAISRVKVTGPSVMLQHPDYEAYMAVVYKLLDIDQPRKFVEVLGKHHPALVETDPGELWLDSFLRTCDRFPTLTSFLQHVRYSIEKSKEPKNDAVKCMSIHASKGLEFGTVFIANMVEGCIPYKRSIEEGIIDEETRLAYVAMTRAKDRLYLCVPKTIGNTPREVSRYLEELKGDSTN